MYAISSGLLEADDLKVFTSVAELIGEELNLACCSIWRREPGTPGPERLGYYERLGEVILDYLTNLDYQVASRVTESGEMLVENNIGNTAGFKAGLLCPALIALPLMIGDISGGALCLWVEQATGADAVSISMAREMARLLADGLRLRQNSQPLQAADAGDETAEKEYNLRTAAIRRGQVVPGISLDLRSLLTGGRGGDFYDFNITGDNNLVIGLGTLLGKGNTLPWQQGARLLMKLLARVNAVPAKACSVLSEILYDELHDAGLMMSLLYAGYNPKKGSLSYCNAGCSPPVIFREKTGDYPGGTSQPLIGLKKAPAYEEKSLRLGSGDIAVFYSNGTAEMMNSEGMTYPRERISQTLQKYHYYNAPSLLDCLALDIHQFLGGRRLLEHVSLAVLKVE